MPRGPSREPDPYRYDPAVWRGVPRSFLEDGPACTLYIGTNYLVEADGTQSTVTHEITRFNGRKGIERLGEYRGISYDPAYQDLVLHEARVLKVDGRFVPIEPRHLQLRDVSTNYQVYDHDKQLIISFPNLEVGDAIEVKWTVRGRNPEHLGQFFTRYTFGLDSYPVVRDELRIRLPKDRPLKYASLGGKVEPTVAEEGNARLYRWQVNERRALPQDDDLPSREMFRQQVACSTFASWDEVGAWKVKVRADCWECTEEIRRIVREVAGDLKTPLEKARALTCWVRRNVRYVQVGERHDFTPHTPAAVLACRYGDCKDQSQLLAVMLREAGVPVALATLGTLNDGQVQEAVPSPWGTHAILLVTLDGQDHWIDTTVSLAGWDFLPRDDRDRLCYVLGDKGLRLVRTPPWMPADSSIEQTSRVVLRADGSAYYERTVTYHGSAAITQRDNWMEVPEGERRRLMTAELQDSNSRSHLIRLDVDERRLRDFDRPVVARIAFEVPDQFTGDPVREGSLTDSKVWNKLLGYNLDYDRKVPLGLWAPFELEHRYLIELPPAYVFDGLPRSRTVRSKWGTFSVSVHSRPEEPRRLELVFHTKLDQVAIDPADFDAFRQFHNEVNRDYRVWLSLRPARDLADIPALEAWLLLAPHDTASATILARLYQRHNRLDDARRVLRRAAFFRPEDGTLAELAVGMAADLEGKEIGYRELVRRFPDEPKYAVALGTVLVDRGDYAKARTVLEPLAAKGPASTRGQACFQLARSYLRENRAAKALEQVAAAALADPNSIQNLAGLLFKARVYEKLDRAQEAARTYRDALGLDGESREALEGLVRLALAAGNPGEALDYLRRYTLVVGNDVVGLATAADFHLRLGRYEDAFDLATRAQEQRFHPRAQAVLGLVYRHRGDHSRAVFHLERADADAAVLEGLMRSYVHLGKLREAEDQLRRTETVPMTTGLTEASALVRSLQKRREELVEEARAPFDQVDIWRNAVGHYVCAEYAHAQGRPAEQVEALLKPVRAEDVDYGPAHALLGLVALDKGRLLRAASEAEKALALDPRSTQACYVRGRARLERGLDGALEDLERAALLSKRQDATVLHWLATALWQAGRHEDALTTQRVAARLRPGDEAIQDQLREMETEAARP